MKKIGKILGLLFGCMSLASATEQGLIHYDVVLVTAERNCVRMEKYSVEEFASETCCLTKEFRDEHCMLEIMMNEPGAGVISLQWDVENIGCIAMKTGKKDTPCSYIIDLFTLFDFEQMPEVIVMPFDTSMVEVPMRVEQCEDEPVWITCAQAQFPAQDDAVSTVKFLFDTKVKSACGLIVSDALFVTPLRVSGKIKKRIAMDCGLLHLNMICRHEDESVVADEAPLTPPNTPITTEEPKQAVLLEVFSDEVVAQQEQEINQAVQHVQQAVQIAEDALLQQQENFVQELTPTVLALIQENTKIVFNVISEYVGSAWKAVATFLFGAK